MENLVGKVKNLIDDFVEETGNELRESVYEKFYAYLATSFDDVVEERCKIVLFGRKYALSARDIYNYDRCIAVEAWNDHVENRFVEFQCWVEWSSISDDLNEFTEEFQQWLASQDDERTSDVIVALMIGDADLTEVVVEWLYERLQGEDWDYPV